jgi:hypothetical protein
MDRGEEAFRAPLDQYRASVLWKADIYTTEEARQRVADDFLSLDDVVRIYNDDLAKRGEDVRLDVEKLDDAATVGAVAAVYPEAKPIGAGVSMFEV